MKLAAICLLAALVGVGCSKQKAQDALRSATSRLSAEYDQAKVADHAQRVLSAVDDCDLPALKELCSDGACADYADIMGCYYQAFAIENGQGVAPARAYLADQTAREDNSPAKAKALSAINSYFSAKGTLRTRELAGIVLCIALETKYPHRGGVIGEIIAVQLGLLNSSRPASRPAATNPA